MHTTEERSKVQFEPIRPASRSRRAVAFALGALVWIAAGYLAIALLGHTHIVVRLLLVTAVSCVAFSLLLAWGMALRSREERREAA
ncbi:hypothetical protein OG746_04135 [Streptomyces sp. NBC_01016]|uniref:hypothetical protein n=1 Tax=Streptomyces sp. NBC_01016 TaxID=2903720 RepID=UPI002253125E|nr:hypothetical protein [Streptomyces sp. NBC_01016]MCX4827927.1 hypothetical protein [Streptomyces sp. NBC_01016]